MHAISLANQIDLNVRLFLLEYSNRIYL